MEPRARVSDDELLCSADADAFGLFYDRYAASLLAYFMRRTRDPELAADLTAETFASAIVARRRFTPGPVPPVAWLYAIAARRLADSRRRGHADARMRRALELERPALTAEDADTIRLLADETSTSLLERLPADQRRAIVGRVIEQREYPELAAAEGGSEAVIRQRVSRGLATLRRCLGAKP